MAIEVSFSIPYHFIETSGINGAVAGNSTGDGEQDLDAGEVMIPRNSPSKLLGVRTFHLIAFGLVAICSHSLSFFLHYIVGRGGDVSNALICAERTG